MEVYSLVGYYGKYWKKGGVSCGVGDWIIVQKSGGYSLIQVQSLVVTTSEFKDRFEIVGNVVANSTETIRFFEENHEDTRT